MRKGWTSKAWPSLWWCAGMGMQSVAGKSWKSAKSLPPREASALASPPSSTCPLLQNLGRAATAACLPSLAPKAQACDVVMASAQPAWRFLSVPNSPNKFTIQYTVRLPPCAAAWLSGLQ